MIKRIFWALVFVPLICIASDFNGSRSSGHFAVARKTKSNHTDGSSKGNFFSGTRTSHRNAARQLSPVDYSNMFKCTALTYKLRKLQKSGNIDGLRNELQLLQQARIMPHRQRKIDEVRSILDEPMTQIFDVIKNGTLDQAQDAMRRIFTLSPFKYKFGRFESQDLFEAKQLYYQQYYSYDVLYEAKKLYESRADASKVYEHHDSFPISFEDHRVYGGESSSSYFVKQEAQETFCKADAFNISLSQDIHQDASRYQELYDNVLKNCVSLQDKIGFVTDYYQSREQALKQIISGDHAIYEQTHNLSSQAQHILQSHGFDPMQFTQCKGNLLQQDTNAKLVQTLNDLAHKSITTRTAMQIKKGVLECVQAGNELNQNGNVKEAIFLSDLCHVAVELWHSIEKGIEIGKGVADGLCVGVSSEIVQALRDPHVLQETVLTTGSWAEADLRTQVAMETSIIVSDLLRIIKDSGEIAFSGVLGVGDAIIGMPELASNCIEVTRLTVECLAPLAKETVYLMGAAERKNVDDFQKYLTNVQYEYGRLSQGVSAFMGQLKDQKSCVNGQITKADAKYWARSGARMATEYIMFEQALKGASKIMKGVSTYLKSTEAALGGLQGMKELSKAQVRNVLLAAQLEGSEPLLQMSSLSGKSAAIKQVMVPIQSLSCASEMGSVVKSVEGAAKGAIQEVASIQGLSQNVVEAAESIVQPAASTSSSAAQKLTSLSYATKELKQQVKPYLAEHKAKQQKLCVQHNVYKDGGYHPVTEFTKEGHQQLWNECVASDLEIDKLAKPFDHTCKTHNDPRFPEHMINDPKSIRFEHEHLRKPDIRVKCSKAIPEYSVSGFHHDPMGKVENSGLIDIRNKKELPHGCYAYEWKYDNADFKLSTFFPKEWSSAEVYEKVLESMKNTKEIKYKVGNGCYTHIGTTVNGLEIEALIEFNQKSAYIKTVYPKN